MSQRLCRKLGYTFQNQALLRQALSHCSVGDTNNERLEFLGDSILNFVIANQLFLQFPSESEGQLSRLRAFLVKGDTLADMAKELALGDALLLGPGELRSGGFRRASILSDALEAIFAAIYLDGGFKAAEEVILTLYHERLQDSQLKKPLKDPKTELQELLQGRKIQLPEYTLDKTEGEEHAQRFFVTCSISQLALTTLGEGVNRRQAEQAAAKRALEKIK